MHYPRLLTPDQQDDEDVDDDVALPKSVVAFISPVSEIFRTKSKQT
jgi:hypothetical protein